MRAVVFHAAVVVRPHETRGGEAVEAVDVEVVAVPPRCALHLPHLQRDVGERRLAARHEQSVRIDGDVPEDTDEVVDGFMGQDDAHATSGGLLPPEGRKHEGLIQLEDIPEVGARLLSVLHTTWSFLVRPDY